MKVAIISDIHGNLEALNTVLEDIKNRGIEKIYCLGDIIAKGNNSKECLDLVRENCEVIVYGNVDYIYSEDLNLDELPDLERRRIIWNREKLADGDLEYLHNLPFCYEFYMSGRLIRLFHAHPEKHDKFVGTIDRIEKYAELFMPSEKTISNELADVVIYGHIHEPYVQKLYNRFIINSGSVGNAFDVFRNEKKDANPKFTTVANYLILNGNLDSRNADEPFSFEIVSLPYDIDKELSTCEGHIELDVYTNELKKGIYRDMEKVYRTFESRGIDKDKI